jgi:hypothetical protein
LSVFKNRLHLTKERNVEILFVVRMGTSSPIAKNASWLIVGQQSVLFATSVGCTMQNPLSG